ncbi:hypothetical protein J22TS1_03540 [Siminovitchia terrae]|nr:hypothetical protein J22TS1_03540 [Siminovitchia terrae]
MPVEKAFGENADPLNLIWLKPAKGTSNLHTLAPRVHFSLGVFSYCIRNYKILCLCITCLSDVLRPAPAPID